MPLPLDKQGDRDPDQLAGGATSWWVSPDVNSAILPLSSVFNLLYPTASQYALWAPETMGVFVR